jgi:LysM repeat protein
VKEKGFSQIILFIIIAALSASTLFFFFRSQMNEERSKRVPESQQKEEVEKTNEKTEDEKIVEEYLKNKRKRELESTVEKGLHNNCPRYGSIPKEEYLQYYVVQEGDTLQSITNEQLGDPSKINDLVLMNNDIYPGLSIQNSELTPGWKIYLPPLDYLKYGTFSSGGMLAKGGMYANAGEITSIDKDGSVRVEQPGAFWGFHIKNVIHYPDGNDFQVGDCVIVIGAMDWSIDRVYMVTIQ